MEGADAIRSREDVGAFHARGLRIVGLSWQRTRMAGGTGEPGPLTNEGRQCVKWLDEFKIIHDTSHLSDESFWELLDRTNGPVIASHSNVREIVPTDRQISDDMIKAIVARGGVIGLNFYDEFLVPPEQFGKRKCAFSDVIDHMKHMTDLIGNANHVALGTDLDGGVGKDDVPCEIETAADLPKLADALSAAGYSDTDIEGILWKNWLRYFKANLLQSA
jgi:membrane dipeptidase